MKKFAKFMTGAAAAALVSVTFAAPAQAQYSRYDRYDRRYDRGIDAGDIISGIAILGGVAAVTSALGRDYGRYGYRDRYSYRDRYRDGYTAAVNSCGYEAERIGRGRVRITDVDRVRGDEYRVRGVVEADHGSYGSYGSYGRNDRYDRYGSYGSYGRNDRYDRYGSYGRYDRNDRYGRYDRGSRYGDDFTCYTYGNGRISDFRI